MVKIPENIGDSGRKWLNRLFSEFSFDKSEREACFLAGSCLDRIDQAEQAIKTHGILVDCPTGMKANPACAIERDSKTLFCRICRELGITGSEDTRLPRKGRP